MTDRAPAAGRRWIGGALGLAVSAVALVAFFWNVAVVDLWAAMRGADLLLLLAVNLFSVAILAVRAWRSRAIFGAEGQVSTVEHAKAHLLALVGNVVLPFRLGDALRAVYLSGRSGAALGGTVALVALEQVLDVWILLALGIAVLPGLLGAGATPALVALAAGLSALLVLGAVAARHRVVLVEWVRDRGGPGLAGRVADLVSKQLEGVLGTVDRLRRPRRFAAATGSTLLVWLTTAGAIATAMLAFDISLGWFGPVVVLTMVSVGSMLPSAPAAVGTYHFFAQQALTLQGVDPVKAAAFAVVMHALSTLPWLLLGAPAVYHEIGAAWGRLLRRRER